MSTSSVTLVCRLNNIINTGMGYISADYKSSQHLLGASFSTANSPPPPSGKAHPVREIASTNLNDATRVPQPGLGIESGGLNASVGLQRGLNPLRGGFSLAWSTLNEQTLFKSGLSLESHSCRTAAARAIAQSDCRCECP
jgi:hypothetical protein